MRSALSAAQNLRQVGFERPAGAQEKSSGSTVSPLSWARNASYLCAEFGKISGDVQASVTAIVFELDLGSTMVKISTDCNDVRAFQAVTATACHYTSRYCGQGQAHRNEAVASRRDNPVAHGIGAQFPGRPHRSLLPQTRVAERRQPRASGEARQPEAQAAARK